MANTILRHRVLPTQSANVRADLSKLAAAVRAAETLAPGETGPAVSALQRALRGIGAYDGPVNGTYDAATQAAVTGLETAKGLTADGTFDAAELGALRGQQLFVQSGFETPARPGEKGTDIRAIETKLQNLGFNVGTVDGEYDAKLQSAVKAYRLQNDSVPDRPLVIGKRVAQGLTRDVKELELNLKLLGRDPGKADGRFTANTARAVRAFQRKNGLDVTGEANRRTRTLADRQAAGAGRFPDVKPGAFQRGYDISHWQSDGTFRELLSRPGTRFMAIKATDGTGFVDPEFRSRWAALGKKLEPGKFDARIAYHFLQPGNGRAQADHFLRTLGINGPLKPGTKLSLDWEAAALRSPQTLRDAANRIHQVTGEWPLIYCSASNIPTARRMVPHAPMWDAHWTPNNSDYQFPFVQTGIKGGVDQDVFTGSELALRKWAGWF